MKPVVLLGILCAALAGALFLRHTRANRAVETVLAREQQLSNQVAQLQTKLVLAQGQAVREATNHEAVLQHRTRELLNASNVIVRLRDSLAATQEDAANSRSQIQTQAARLSELEGQRDESARKVETLQPLVGQLDDLRQRWTATVNDRDGLLRETQRLQMELAELQRQIDNPDFLRWQSARVQADLDAAKRATAAKPGARVDLSRPVRMENDGTVRLVPPPTRQEKP